MHSPIACAVHDEIVGHLKEMGLPHVAKGNGGQGTPAAPPAVMLASCCPTAGLWHLRMCRFAGADNRRLTLNCFGSLARCAGGPDRRGVSDEGNKRPASVKASLSGKGWVRRVADSWSCMDRHDNVVASLRVPLTHLCRPALLPTTVAMGQRAPNRAGTREQGRGMGTELQGERLVGGGSSWLACCLCLVHLCTAHLLHSLFSLLVAYAAEKRASDKPAPAPREDRRRDDRDRRDERRWAAGSMRAGRGFMQQAQPLGGGPSLRALAESRLQLHCANP